MVPSELQNDYQLRVKVWVAPREAVTSTVWVPTPATVTVIDFCSWVGSETAKCQPPQPRDHNTEAGAETETRPTVPAAQKLAPTTSESS